MNTFIFAALLCFALSGLFFYKAYRVRRQRERVMAEVAVILNRTEARLRELERLTR